MRNSILFSAFLDAVNIVFVAIIIAICYQMGKDTISDWRTIIVAVASLILTFGFRKINNAFIVLGGSLTGYMLTLI